jgi:hypothetical protein
MVATLALPSYCQTPQSSIKTGTIATSGGCSPVLVQPNQPITIQCSIGGLTPQQIKEQRQQYAEILNSVRTSGLKLDQILELEKQIVSNQTAVTTNLQRQGDFDMIQSFINGAERGEGQSFDMLGVMLMMSNLPKVLHDEADKEYFRVIHKYQNEKYVRQLLPNLTAHPSDESLIWCLENKDETLRRQAIDTADVRFITKNIDAIFQVMISDSSLMVRDAAYRRFLESVGQPAERFFLFPDKESLETWWGENRNHLVANPSAMPRFFSPR